MVASSNKTLHKIVLYSIKTIPMLISGIYVLNTVLSYYGIDSPILSYAVQFLFIDNLYLLSFAFKFCSWHRVFITYIVVILFLNIIDYHIGIPISDRHLFLMYGILTGLFLFTALYLKFRKS